MIVFVILAVIGDMKAWAQMSAESDPGSGSNVSQAKAWVTGGPAIVNLTTDERPFILGLHVCRSLSLTEQPLLHGR